MSIESTIRARHKLDEKTVVKCIVTSAVLKSADDDDPYKFSARITTDALDRQDEAVLPEGGDLTEFYQCGCIAWNHDYSSPVGFPNRLKGANRSHDFIDIGGIFMKRPADFQGDFFPDVARAFVTQARAAGINPGVSIGFIPTESRLPSKADKGRWGDRIQMVHSKWKLLELSVAPVQANHQAVVTAVGKGLIRPDVAKAVGISVENMPKIITETLCVSFKTSKVDAETLLRESVENEILKSFGKIYA